MMWACFLRNTIPKKAACSGISLRPFPISPWSTPPTTSRPKLSDGLHITAPAAPAQPTGHNPSRLIRTGSNQPRSTRSQHLCLCFERISFQSLVPAGVSWYHLYGHISTNRSQSRQRAALHGSQDRGRQSSLEPESPALGLSRPVPGVALGIARGV